MSDETSPLDELRRPADDAWQKIHGGDQPTDDDLNDIITYERAARTQWLKDDEVKRNKRAK